MRDLSNRIRMIEDDYMNRNTLPVFDYQCPPINEMFLTNFEELQKFYTLSRRLNYCPVRDRGINQKGEPVLIYTLFPRFLPRMLLQEKTLPNIIFGKNLQPRVID